MEMRVKQDMSLCISLRIYTFKDMDAYTQITYTKEK